MIVDHMTVATTDVPVILENIQNTIRQVATELLQLGYEVAHIPTSQSWQEWWFGIANFWVGIWKPCWEMTGHPLAIGITPGQVSPAVMSALHKVFPNSMPIRYTGRNAGFEHVVTLTHLMNEPDPVKAIVSALMMLLAEAGIVPQSPASAT